jgi:hypothetical protein
MLKSRQQRHHLAGITLYNFTGVALFPGRVTLFYPPLWRSPVGVALHISYRVLFAFAMHRWVIPGFKATPRVWAASPHSRRVIAEVQGRT